MKLNTSIISQSGNVKRAPKRFRRFLLRRGFLLRRAFYARILFDAREPQAPQDRAQNGNAPQRNADARKQDAAIERAGPI